MEKECTKCKEIKDISNFYKNSKKDGYRSICKQCYNEKTKSYYDENKDTLTQYKKEWREKNIDKILEDDKLKRNSLTESDKIKISEYNKNWREGNKETQKLKKQEYYQDNREDFLLKSKKYREENKDKIKDYQFNYRPIKNTKRKERLKSDILFSVEKSIRNNIYDCFKRNGYKKSSRTYEILGCTFEEFKIHLEKMFEDWMNWENKGLYNGELKYGWDIDHRIPISSATSEEEMIKLNHYTNLQPLCSYTNRYIKRDHLDT
jgi:hypothetical protein